MLAPFIFKTFAILIKERFSILRITYRFSRSSDDLTGASTVYRHLIKFGHGRSREEGTLSRILNGSREYHMLAVRRESRRQLRNRMLGQFLGTSPVCRHDIDVKITVTVACESNLLAIRRPNRCTFIRSLSSELLGCSSLRVHGINISLITECYSVSIRRNLHITHPQRSNRLACKCSQAKSHTSE